MIHGPSVGLGAGIAAITLIAVFVAAQGLQINTAQNDNLADIKDIKQESELTMIHMEDIPSAPDTNPQDDLILVTTLLDNGSPILGSESAPITLVEFGDYQCHFCNVFFHSTEKQILENYINTGKVKLIFKDYHIIGPDSVDASHGAHCAGDQGLFWEYHDVLYDNWSGENTGWASYENLESFAANMEKLNYDMWVQCMVDRPHSQKILASNEDAHTLGLTGTPAFYILDSNQQVHLIVGAQPYTTFTNVFDASLKN